MSSSQGKNMSNFSLTCSIMSKCFMPHRHGKYETPRTMNLLSCMDGNIEEAIKPTNPPLPPTIKAQENNVASPMIIFYDGKVVVIDHFPEDKAKWLMAAIASTPNNIAPSSTSSSSNAKTVHKPHYLPNTIVLPMARRASLSRFLLKRRERVGAASPYQPSRLDLNASIEEKATTKVKPGKIKAEPWIGLASLNH